MSKQQASMSESSPKSSGLPRQPNYNAETEAAMREAKQIAAGMVPVKTYDTVQELFEDLDSEC